VATSTRDPRIGHPLEAKMGHLVEAPAPTLVYATIATLCVQNFLCAFHSEWLEKSTKTTRRNDQGAAYLRL
jgi:hypothetical protein